MSWTRRWVRLRATGWPTPEDPNGDEDADLDGRELIADRLVDEVGWLRQCSGWLTRLHAGESRPAVNLRRGGDDPERRWWWRPAEDGGNLDRTAAHPRAGPRRRVDDLAAAAARPADAPKMPLTGGQPDLSSLTMAKIAASCGVTPMTVCRNICVGLLTSRPAIPLRRRAARSALAGAERIQAPAEELYFLSLNPGGLPQRHYPSACDRALEPVGGLDPFDVLWAGSSSALPCLDDAAPRRKPAGRPTPSGGMLLYRSLPIFLKPG